MALNYTFGSARRVLITGGGQGVGRVLVQKFVDDGATVFTIDKNEQLMQKLAKEQPKVTAKAVDLMDWKATREAVESFGRIDHLVNNAAITIPQPFLEVTEDIAALQYGVNVGAVINLSQTVAKGMVKAGSGGTIVNMSSMAAKTTLPGVSVYGASKAATVMLTKSMAVELGPHKIRVNCILPGAIETPMVSVEGQPGLQKMLSKMVIQRTIKPSEIGDLVMFLSSPLSTMITGTEVVIDGGYSTT